MARTRQIKPAFYKNEKLASCTPHARLLFPGLWCLADRCGRLEDRPMRIKAELFPYESVDIEALLDELIINGFITRYKYGTSTVQVSWIVIHNFEKHQHVNVKEQESELPDFNGLDNCTIQAPYKYGASTEVARPYYLNTSIPHTSVPHTDLPNSIDAPSGEGTKANNQNKLKDTAHEKAKRNTTSPFPHGEQCPDEWANWASRNTSFTQSDIDRQYATARDWALGKGERKADWLAFWRNWCRRNDGSAAQQRDSFAGGQKKSPLAAAYAAVVASREGSE